MKFDLPDAKLPDLRALQNSWVENDPLAAEMNQLTVQLFKESLAEQTFDINVLGVPHLGSFSLVRRAVNADGLALLSGEGEEAATRYLYRAWKGQNGNGRGLHFLRTYMQMLYPNKWSVAQLWQDPALPYTVGMQTEQQLDSPYGPGKSGWMLTSRVRVGIDYDAPLATSFTEMLKVLANVLPARIVPEFATRVPASVGGGDAKTGVGVRAIGHARISPEIVLRAQSVRHVHAHAVAVVKARPRAALPNTCRRLTSAAAAPVLRIGGIPPWQEWHLPPKPVAAVHAQTAARAFPVVRCGSQPEKMPVSTRVGARAFVVVRAGAIPDWTEWHTPAPTGAADDFYRGLVTGYATGTAPHWNHGEDSDVTTVQMLNHGMLPF